MRFNRIQSVQQPHAGADGSDWLFANTLHVWQYPETWETCLKLARSGCIVTGGTINSVLTIDVGRPNNDVASMAGIAIITSTKRSTQMTLTILKQAPNQKIARPFSRACSLEEAAEIVASHAVYLQCERGGKKAGECRRYAEQAGETHRKAPGKFFTTANIDSDQPVYRDGQNLYFIFTE